VKFLRTEYASLSDKSEQLKTVTELRKIGVSELNTSENCAFVTRLCRLFRCSVCGLFRSSVYGLLIDNKDCAKEFMVHLFIGVHVLCVSQRNIPSVCQILIKLFDELVEGALAYKLGKKKT